MDVYFQSQIGVCSEFRDGPKKLEISVVISPIKVTTNEQGNEIKVISGCNMWRSCRNQDCFFSLKSRLDTDKVQKKEPR